VGITDKRSNRYDELPHRQRNRLLEYDYGQVGAYFITVCVKDRRAILGKVAVDEKTGEVSTFLYKAGYVVENEINVLSNIYDNVVVDKYVIMPNHIHMIIIISDVIRRGGLWPPADTNGLPEPIEINGRPKAAPTVSQMMNKFKGSVTKKLGYSIWQKSFYDHVIRDEKDYNVRWIYIDDNPARWAEDEYNS